MMDKQLIKLNLLAILEATYIGVGASTAKKGVQCVSRCNDFRSRKGPDFDERFLVEDASRRIGWSSYLLTRPLREDVDEAEMQGKLRIVIAGDTEPLNYVKQTNEMANCESEAMQTQEGKTNKGRDPNLSKIWERDAKKFKFLDSVVLALAAPIRSDKQLPLKKRKIRGLWKITMNDARKGKGKGITVADIKTKAMPMTQTEFSSTFDCNMVSKNINCLLNCESSIPCPPADTAAVSTTTKTAIETEIKPKRKRGRPRRTITMNNECEC